MDHRHIAWNPTRVRAHVLLVLIGLASACVTHQEPAADAPSAPATARPSGASQLPPSPSAQMPALEPGLFPEPGATSFETAKDIGESDGRGDPGLGVPQTPTAGSANAAEGVDDEGAAPPGLPAPTPTAPSGGTPSAQREIVEADVVQASGDILYVLNRFRGLVLIDLSDPDGPFVAGRVPFQAVPVDMYLRDGNAYIVMSDYFSYFQFDADADPLGFHGSQVLVVDVTDATHPQVTGSFPVDGEVTDTRIVGDVLYAVSKRNPQYWRYDTQDWQDTTWVLSIDVSNPTAIHEVATHEFPGAATVIQVYETALSVAAIDPNYFLVDEDNAQQTLITYVDISDPKGAIRVGGSAYVPGAVEDKFKMDLHEGHLRVISQNWFWRPESQASLTVLDATAPDKLSEVARISLASAANDPSNARPHATRFAGDAMFVSLCWWNVSTQECRVDSYRLADPKAPTRASETPLSAAITHFEVRGDRLLALGATWSNIGQSVQVFLFDSSDLGALRQLSSVNLGGDRSTGSTALNDYKAFKVLDELQMILLPLDWATQSNTFYKQHFGAQIIDWRNDQLTTMGRIEQTSNVERAIAFRDRVLSISNSEVQVIDASDRNKPVATASLFLVRNVIDVFNIGGYQVQLGVDEADETVRFFVLPFGEDDMAKSVATLDVGSSVSHQIQSGDIIHVFAFDRENGAQRIRNADFSDPLKPRWRGDYPLPGEVQHIYGGGYYYGHFSFYDYYWNPGAGQPLENDLLPVTVRDVTSAASGRRNYDSYLALIDLRDPDRPRLAGGRVEMNEWPFINRVDHGTMLYSTHSEPALDENMKPKAYHERYFLDRIDARDPEKLVALPKVNIPGRLIDVDKSGRILYTLDYQWDEFGRRRNAFNVLRLDGNTATLTAVIPVADEIDRAKYLDREVWFSTHSYPWWGRRADSPDSRQPYTRLTRLRFDEAANLVAEDHHDIRGYHFDLLDVDAPTVYLASSYPTGLLILDTTSFESPTVLGAARTVGYISKLTREADFLYAPMGAYGVRRVQAP